MSAPVHSPLQTIDQVHTHLLAELEHFFRSYNELRGKQFKPLGHSGPERARQMTEENLRAQNLRAA